MNEELRRADFRRQFLLSREPERPLAEWQTTVVSPGWFLHRCPTLPVCNVAPAGACAAVWILGWAISAEGRVLGAPPAASCGDSQADLERLVEGLAGRFIAIVVRDLHPMVYLDPAGQLSAVHHAQTGAVASSLFLVSPVAEPSGELVRLLDFPAVDQYFPFGITHDPHVTRLTPNHVLDLSTGEVTRHWPRRAEAPTDRSPDPQAIARSIGQKLRRNIEAISDTHGIAMPLTAGVDSRMLLAASRRVLPKIHFYTVRIPDDTAKLDCRTARTLARRHQLNYRTLKWLDAMPRELHDWQLRGGYAGAGRTWKAVRTLEQLDPGLAVLEGLCGEVGRAYYWRRGDFESTRLTPHDVLTRLGFPAHPRLLDAADRWLSAVPARDQFDVLDLLYIEQRLGCWAGPHHVGHVHNLRIVPLSDREIFSSMMSLQPEYRFEQRLGPDVIRSLWPELLGMPFNRSGPLRAVLGRCVRMCRRSAGFIKRLGSPS